MFVRLCTLSGIDSDSIPIDDYQKIKLLFQPLIDKFQLKIELDDNKRQIHFDYTPEEIDAIYQSIPSHDEFFEKIIRYSKQPFDSYRWGGHKYCLHYNEETQCIKKINELCISYNELEKNKEQASIDFNFSTENKNINNLQEKYLLIQNVIQNAALHNKVKGFFLGEIHAHKYPKQFLITHLKFFKTLGINTLFFEFLCYDRHQKALDAYFNNIDDDLPFDLSAYLQYKDEISNCRFSGYTDIVKAAKKAGIRIVALDCYESIIAERTVLKEFVDQYARIKSFNYYAYKIIEQENKGEAFLAFTGIAHCYIPQCQESCRL
jgi:hypothetical protein